MQDDMYFPYLTAEIKCGNQALEFADRLNLHIMCIELLSPCLRRPVAPKRCIGVKTKHITRQHHPLIICKIPVLMRLYPNISKITQYNCELF